MALADQQASSKRTEGLAGQVDSLTAQLRKLEADGNAKTEGFEQALREAEARIAEALEEAQEARRAEAEQRAERLEAETQRDASRREAEDARLQLAGGVEVKDMIKSFCPRCARGGANSQREQLAIAATRSRSSCPTCSARGSTRPTRATSTGRTTRSRSSRSTAARRRRRKTGKWS